MAVEEAARSGSGDPSALLSFVVFPAFSFWLRDLPSNVKNEVGNLKVGRDHQLAVNWVGYLVVGSVAVTCSQLGSVVVRLGALPPPQTTPTDDPLGRVNVLSPCWW